MFFDAHVHNKDSFILKYIEKKPPKNPAHWFSKIHKRYKRHSIKVDLHRAKKVSANFKEETKFIRNKFVKANFSYYSLTA